MKTDRSLKNVHPILVRAVRTIQADVIDTHKMPMRLFETSRSKERHKMLVSKGKTKNIISSHLYDLEHNPPLYSTALKYVYFDTKWSWNLRDSTINAWYILFGNLVLDTCPELQWSGLDRKAVNFCHFELRQEIVLKNLKEYPCVV